MDYAVSENRENSKWFYLIADFANVLKAFVGTNYLSLPFAFSQSGLCLGIGGVILIAFLTDYCCNLIVQCKYIAIEKVLKMYQDDIMANEEDSWDGDDEYVRLQNMMKRAFSYGDVGKVSIGRTGTYLVNFFVFFTQFGFCVGYFIFIGNTVHYMIPATHMCLVKVLNNSIPDKTIVTEHTLPVVNITSAPWASTETTPLFSGHMAFQKINLTFLEIYDSLDCNSNSSGDSSTKDSRTGLNSNFLTLTLVQLTKSPKLYILILSPLPVFILFSMLRNLRILGYISVLADVFIFFGWVSILTFLLIGFSVSREIKWASSGFLVFFGLITSSFEGIGTILPIECSMEGNRHNFSKFLHATIITVGLVFTGFGLLGYLRYASGVNQMINLTVLHGGIWSLVLNIGLVIGVLCTFPLMMFPVIELLEKFVFGDGNCNSMCLGSQGFSNSGKGSTDSPQDTTALLRSKKKLFIPVGTCIPESVPNWKRNFVRSLLILATGGLAVLFRHNFAYVTAFIGALGSSFLAYILPCVFYMGLRRGELGLLEKLKYFTIITIGVVGGGMSLYAVVHEIIWHTKGGSH